MFITSNVDEDTRKVALGSLTAILAASVVYLMKASSDATHSDQMKQMTDALANSTPTKNA